MSKDCGKIMIKRSKTRLKWLKDKTEEAWDALVDIRRAACAIFRSKKRQYLKRKIVEIDENCRSSNLYGIYMGINNVRKGVRARTKMIRDKNDNLITNSGEVLNV